MLARTAKKEKPGLTHEKEAFDEAFNCLVGDIGVSGKYARMYEERIKLDVAEVGVNNTYCCFSTGDTTSF